MKPTYRQAFAACALMLLTGAGVAQESYEFDAEDVASKLASMLGSETDIQVYEAQLRRLEEASESFTPEQAQEVMAQLKAEETTINEAEAQFDAMIDQIEQTQALGDPDGEFVRFMNDMQLRARDEAADAAKAGDQEFAAAFNALATEFEAIRDRAIEARNDAIPAIDFLKQNKDKYVRAKKLRALAQIAVISEEAVMKVEEQSETVRSAASALRSAADPATSR